LRQRQPYFKLHHLRPRRHILSPGARISFPRAQLTEGIIHIRYTITAASSPVTAHIPPRLTMFTDLNTPPKPAQRVCRRRPNFGLLTPTPANPVKRRRYPTKHHFTPYRYTTYLCTYLSFCLPSQWGDRLLSDKCYFPNPDNFRAHNGLRTRKEHSAKTASTNGSLAEGRQLVRGALLRRCKGMSRKSTPTSSTSLREPSAAALLASSHSHH